MAGFRVRRLRSICHGSHCGPFHLNGLFHKVAEKVCDEYRETDYVSISIGHSDSTKLGLGSIKLGLGSTKLGLDSTKLGLGSTKLGLGSAQFGLH